MKNLFLVVGAMIIVLITSGCAGPRTASIGYRNSAVPILTTNMVGTVSASGVEGQPKTLTTTTNWSIVSTTPIPERTWRELALGQRPPGATAPLVIPPFPDEGGATLALLPEKAKRKPKSKKQYFRSGNGSTSFSGRSGLGQPNPRASLQKSPGSRADLGKDNPRAGLKRTKRSRTSLGRSNPRANLSR